MDAQYANEPCPRCASANHVLRKLLLLNKGTLSEAASQFRPGGSSHGGFTFAGLKPDFLALGSDSQFVVGLYCTSCDVGFVPESIAKPEAPSYKAFPDGWRRVFPNGELGPLLERIEDDAEPD